MFSADSTQVSSSGPDAPGSLWVSNQTNSEGQQGIGIWNGVVTAALLPAPISGIALTNNSSLNGGIQSGTVAGFFIKADGSLWGVGWNGTSELGINNFSYQATPVFVDAGPWVWVANTNNVSAGIKSDGTLWTWGFNLVGQLGLGDISNRTIPTKVGTRTDWTQVRVSVNSMVALRSDNTLWGWGSNTYGNLGTGARVNTSSPVQVAGSWQSVGSTSQSTTFGIRTDGSLWSWGRNFNGALGLSGSTTAHRSSPVQIGTATDWAAINTGYTSVYARKTNGQVWAWGLGTNGQLGDNARISRSSPVQVAFGGTAAWAGPLYDYGALIVDTSGNAWTWGLADTKQYLWSAGTQSRSSPVQIGSGFAAVAPVCWAGSASKVPAQGASLALKANGDALFACTGNYFYVYNIRANQPSTTSYGTSPVWAHGKMAIGLQTGAENGLLAIKDDGTLWVWGGNTQYMLGLGDTFPRSSPVQLGASTWTHVAAGGNYAGGVQTNGTLWMWGKNQTGCIGNNLGSGTVVSPVQIGSLTTWASVACSSNFIDALGCTTLAVKTDGTLWGWGGNDTGQIGDNTLINRSSPVQVGVAVGAQFNWAQVSVNGENLTASETSSAGVKTDGTLWTWGSNRYGRLGLNGGGQRNYPVQVGTDTNWAKVVVGNQGVVALKTNGTIWCWGYAIDGQNGDNTSIDRSSPVQVGSLTDWVDCWRGYAMTVGVRSDGSMWAWGAYSGYFRGQQVQQINSSSPVQISSGTSTGTTGWKSVVTNSRNSTTSVSIMATKE